MGYSLWGSKESDRTEWLHFHFQKTTDGKQNTVSVKVSVAQVSDSLRPHRL